MRYITIKFREYFDKPIHLFGGLGIIIGLIGIIMSLYLSYEKFVGGLEIGNRPLLLLSVLIIFTGLMLFVFGLLADILVRIYYKNQDSYSIK